MKYISNDHKCPMISNKCLNQKEPNLYRSLENISNSMVSKKTKIMS